MTTAEVTKLEPGTKVFLIQDAEIQAWQTIGFHPKHPQYFYLVGNGSVEKVKCLFLGQNSWTLRWEIEYDAAKEIMWQQLTNKVKAINSIYMNDEGSLNLYE